MPITRRGNDIIPQIVCGQCKIEVKENREEIMNGVKVNHKVGVVEAVINLSHSDGVELNPQNIEEAYFLKRKMRLI